MIEEGCYLTEVRMPSDAPAFVYLTRDSYEDGTLSNVVEVWPCSPKVDTNHDGKNALWRPKPDAPTLDLLMRVSLDAAKKYFRTIPETHFECVKIMSGNSSAR